MRGYPTFVLVDADGEEIDRIVGYGGPAHFVPGLARALADPVTVSRREARLASAPTAADAAALGRIMSGRGDAQAAVAHYRRAAELDPAGDYASATFEAVAMGFRRGRMPEKELRAAADAVFAGTDRDPEQLLAVAFQMEAFARRGGRPDLRHPYLGEAVARTAGATGEVAAQRRQLLVPHALHVEREPRRAVALMRESLPAGWRDDPAQLNRFAWWCFEQRLNLREAEALAERGARLAGAGPERAPILDTLAEIRAARGDARGALAAARAAAAAAPDNPDFARQVRRFAAQWRQRDVDR